MSRILPAHVASQIQPMPPNFHPAFEDKGRYVRWSATLQVNGAGPLEVELGCIKRSGLMYGVLLARSAWQAMELARIGRGDLLKHAAVGRHKRG